MKILLPPKKIDFSLKKRLRSFVYAGRGLRIVWQTEFNFRFHLLALAGLIFFGIYLKINSLEWAVVVLAAGGVMASETMNTAVEYLTDAVSPERSEAAGKVKDLAAGAVLLSSIAAVLVGLFIFLPKIFF